ncbi:MAG TPA: CD225/dispanin family protein [Pyrinomonadaceae bacterium]|nr:CD225/dispanin family protein [Pyrinomonadaceae bacterium]
MSQQWSTPSASGATANVQNYLIPAILATLFCCLPVGVVSIIFATQVNSKVAAGDISGAMEASRKAKMFMFIAVGLGLLTWVCAILLWIFVFGMAAVSNM